MIIIEHPISELLDVSMKSLKEMIDANTIFGTPIAYNGTTIIPVSKVKLGFLSGGSDIKPNSNKEDPLFGGATGGGVFLTPIAFLVVQGTSISLLSIDSKTHLIEELIEKAPKLYDKLKTLLENINTNKADF